MPLLRADGTEIQWNVAEVDPAWSIGGFVAPGGARRAGVTSSLASAASSCSSSSSAPSAVAEGADSVVRAVAGRRRLGYVFCGLGGEVLKTIDNLSDFLK